jgi:hypothetical protein
MDAVEIRLDEPNPACPHIDNLYDRSQGQNACKLLLATTYSNGCETQFAPGGEYAHYCDLSCRICPDEDARGCTELAEHCGAWREGGLTCLDSFCPTCAYKGMCDASCAAEVETCSVECANYLADIGETYSCAALVASESYTCGQLVSQDYCLGLGPPGTFKLA